MTIVGVTTTFTRSAEGLAANFYKADRIAQREFRHVVKEHAADVVELTKQYAPVDTGRMRDHVFYTLSPSGLISEQGWFAEDFLPFGLPFYPPYQEFGTIRNAAQPSLYPATMELRPDFLARLGEAASKSMLRGFGRGAP